MTPFPTEADRHRHVSRVCASEAEYRRQSQPDFALVLDGMASRAEARAIATEQSEQPDLFGGYRDE